MGDENSFRIDAPSSISQRSISRIEAIYQQKSHGGSYVFVGYSRSGPWVSRETIGKMEKTTRIKSALSRILEEERLRKKMHPGLYSKPTEKIDWEKLDVSCVDTIGPRGDDMEFYVEISGVMPPSPILLSEIFYQLDQHGIDTNAVNIAFRDAMNRF